MCFKTSSFLFHRFKDAYRKTKSIARNEVYSFSLSPANAFVQSNYLFIIIQNIPDSIFKSFWRQFLNLGRRCWWRNRREAGFSILMNTESVCWGSIYKPFSSHLCPVIRAADVNGGTASDVCYCRFSCLVIEGIHLHAMNQLVDNEKIQMHYLKNGFTITANVGEHANTECSFEH